MDLKHRIVVYDFGTGLHVFMDKYLCKLLYWIIHSQRIKKSSIGYPFSLFICSLYPGPCD